MYNDDTTRGGKRTSYTVHHAILITMITSLTLNVLVSVDTFSGDNLTLLKLERKQMGAYLCIASNDVPPAVSKRITLNVNCEYSHTLLSTFQVNSYVLILFVRVCKNSKWYEPPYSYIASAKELQTFSPY